MYTIAIVIPSYKRPALLNRLLESISKAIFPKSIQSIWIVENGEKSGAEDITSKWVEELPVQYVYDSVANVSNARNVGAKKAEADFVLFFDDDLRCDSNTLIAYDLAVQKYGLKYFFGGPLDIDYEEQPADWLMKYLPWSVQGMSRGDKECKVDEPIFLGGNHLVPRNALLSLGGYDEYCATEDGGAGGEETRLQNQLLASGFNGMYLPGAKVWHYVPKDRCSIEWALYRHYRNGLTDGIFAKEVKKNTDVFFMQAPRWLWRKYIIQKIKVYLYKVIYFYDEERCFKVKFEACNLKGKIDGYLRNN